MRLNLKQDDNEINLANVYDHAREHVAHLLIKFGSVHCDYSHQGCTFWGVYEKQKATEAIARPIYRISFLQGRQIVESTKNEIKNFNNW